MSDATAWPGCMANNKSFYHQADTDCLSGWYRVRGGIKVSHSYSLEVSPESTPPPHHHQTTTNHSRLISICICMEFRIQQGRDDVITEWKGPSATFRPGKGLRHVYFTTQQISSIYRWRECDWWLPPACIKVPTVSYCSCCCWLYGSSEPDSGHDTPDQTSISIESCSAQLQLNVSSEAAPSRPVPRSVLQTELTVLAVVSLLCSSRTIHWYGPGLGDLKCPLQSSVLSSYLQTDRDS